MGACRRQAEPAPTHHPAGRSPHGQPTNPRLHPTRPPDTGQAPNRHAAEGRAELLKHLQTPAARGGHEFGDWPIDQIANGFGGDLDARHRHDHTRLAHEFGHTHPGLKRDALHAARHQPTRTWYGPERVGPER